MATMAANAMKAMQQDPNQNTLSRTAEKLIILLDYSTGLLTRIHNCVHYRRGPVFGQLPEKLVDQLLSKKEDPTLNIQKKEGFNLINMKHDSLCQETQFCYEVIADILLLTNEVHPLFQRLVRDISIFDIHQNTDLTIRFLKVFFNFCRMYLLSSRMSDARIAIYLYMLAYKEQYRKDPDEAHLVKKYLFANIHPLQQLQTLLSTLPRISVAITDAINVIMPSFTTWTSYESQKSGQYFSLSQENPNTFAMPVGVDEKKLQLYNDASHLDHIGTWIIYLYLIFPEQLNEEIPRAQLTAALNDRTVVILYRDELIDAIHEYQALERTSTTTIKVPKKAISKIISMSSSKQSETKKTDALTARHRRMRELLRREIRGLLDVAKAIPGIIPVKLPMFMAAMALARYEIYWVFTHMSLKNNKTKLNFAAPFLPDLMFHCTKLSQLILANADLIHSYYAEQLELDVAEIIPFAASMRKLNKLDISVLDLVDSIVQKVSALGKNSQSADESSRRSMEGLRLSWYRASAEMSKEPSVFRLPQGQAMAKLVNPLIQHTRYFDRLSKEVDARGSMATLWFYRSYLAQIFNTYCLGRFDKEEGRGKKEDNNEEAQFQTVSNRKNKHIPYNRQGRYWIVFLQVYAQALHNVHRQRPEELNIIGLGSLQKAEAYLNATTSKVEVCIRNILGQYSKFNAQIHPETVAEHLIKQRGGQEAETGGKKQRGWKQLPGFESFYPNQSYLASLKHNLDIVGDICASFAECDSVIIHNQRIHPAAYLYQLMHDFFFNEIRLMAQESAKTMVRPQRFLSRLDRLFRACARIGQYINLDLENMVKKILYDDFYDDAVGIAGVSLGMPHKKAETPQTAEAVNDKKKKEPRRKLIHDIRDWYIGIVDARCAAPNSDCLWSPLLHGFYEAKNRNVAANALENYCSITELECLARLIGPSGVRVIDLEVLKIGHAAMQQIKKVLEANRETLQGVDMYRFHSYDRWQAMVRNFKGLDIISSQGVVVGSVMLFRKLLRQALMGVLSSSNNNNNNQFYASTMKVISGKFVSERLYFESISDLALDAGVVNDFTDNVMRNVYYQLANADSALWSYIPLVAGICFSDAFWLNNNVYYNIKLGALSNNGFALADAVSEMITIYTEQTKHRKNKLLFLDIAGKSLLYLKKLYPQNRSINSLFLFLDYFIEINGKDLTHMDLESFSVPYDVIRAQIVKTLGDESGMFTDYTQVVDDAVAPDAQAGGGGPPPKPSQPAEEQKSQ